MSRNKTDEGDSKIIATEKAIEHIGETQGIADAEGDRALQSFWRKVKEQDQRDVRERKGLIAEHVRRNCF